MTTAAFKAKLEQLGLPAREIKVFGVIRMNVHVHCDGLETANKWAAALASVLGTVRVVKSLRDANAAHALKLQQRYGDAIEAAGGVVA